MPVDSTVYPGPRVARFHPLGGGVVRPFFRTEHADVASEQGVSAVLSNVGQILGTPIGSLPWRTDFGGDLERLRHANTNVVRDLAEVYVREALTRWEPRVTLTGLKTTLGADNEVVLRARIAIDGAEGEQLFETPIRRPLQGTAENALAWNLTDSGRSVRGLMTYSDPPRPIQAAEKRPLSKGLMRPIYRDQDFNNSFGVPEVLSNVGQVLGTQKGTLPWRPEFGSDLQRLRHQPNTPALREMARLFVEEAVGRWEPRAQPTAVEVLEPKEAGQNVIVIRAAVRISLLQTGTSTIDISVK